MERDKVISHLMGKKSGGLFKQLKPRNLELLKEAERGTLKLQDFESKNLDLLSNYDSSITNNRTWWFRFNHLPTLAWASGIWTNDKNAKDFIEFNFSVIRNWVSHSDDEIPLKWHDHASAIRMKNLSDWFVTVTKNCDGYERELKELASLIEEHLRWLCIDKNYSKFTNHGFEQARFMIYVASELPGLRISEQALEIGLKRFEEELKFAFTSQGVHKENSPGYQWFMIKVCRESESMFNNYNIDLPSVDLKLLIECAEQFLDDIALPNNTLPLIGDTQFKEKQNKYVEMLRKRWSEKPRWGAFDYSESGYFVVKNISSYLGEKQLIFKNCHLSDYHRHNDDLSIHFSIGDQIILGDSGLFSHRQEDRERKFVKSAWAHNCVFPKDLAEKKIKRKSLVNEPKLNRKSLTSIVGRTWLYYPDAVFQRTLELNTDHKLDTFFIKDQLIKSNTGKFSGILTNFVVPVEGIFKSFEITKNSVLIEYDNYQVSITAEPQCDLRVVEPNGNKSDCIKDMALISKKMSEVGNCIRFEFYWPQEKSETRFKIKVTD